jgi:hypothetical protein
LSSVRVTLPGTRIHLNDKPLLSPGNYVKLKFISTISRAIPESSYIQLGTLRYGVRLSNPNLSQYSNNSLASERQSVHSQQTQTSNLSLGGPSSNARPTTNNNGSVNSTCNGSNCSNNSSQKSSRCCCSNLTMPWNSGGGAARTRLPVPMQGMQGKFHCDRMLRYEGKQIDFNFFLIELNFPSIFFSFSAKVLVEILNYKNLRHFIKNFSYQAQF